MFWTIKFNACYISRLIKTNTVYFHTLFFKETCLKHAHDDAVWNGGKKKKPRLKRWNDFWKQLACITVALFFY